MKTQILIILFRKQYENSKYFSHKTHKNIGNNEVFDSDEEILENKNNLKVANQLLKNIQSDESEDEVMTLNRKSKKDIFSITNEKDDFDLPNDKAWGKQKKAYYSTDYIDSDYAFTNQKDINDAEIEEQEAKNLQNRLATTLDETDFGLDFIDIKKNDYNFDKINEQIKTDLSTLSTRQKYEILKKDNPELMPLTSDFEKYLTEAKMILKPFLNSINSIKCKNYLVVNIIKMKYNLLLHYCMNISFYLILKSKGESVVSHPIIKRLAQYRHMLNQIQQNHGNLIQNFIKISKIHNNDISLNYSSNIDKRNSKVSSQKIAEISKNNNLESAVLSKLSKNIFTTCNDINIKNTVDTDNTDINKFGEIERDKRSITYQIAKNRGLTPYRKKEQRNPRVRHKNKYRKAKICRKGTVREVRKEICRYGGELSGIKASVSKSIKLK